MTYKSAIESINCILLSCDVNTRKRVLAKILKESDESKIEKYSFYNMPSENELLQIIIKEKGILKRTKIR